MDVHDFTCIMETTRRKERRPSWLQPSWDSLLSTSAICRTELEQFFTLSLSLCLSLSPSVPPSLAPSLSISYNRREKVRLHRNPKPKPTPEENRSVCPVFQHQRCRFRSFGIDLECTVCARDLRRGCISAVVVALSEMATKCAHKSSRSACFLLLPFRIMCPTAVPAQPTGLSEENQLHMFLSITSSLHSMVKFFIILIDRLLIDVIMINL